MLTLLGVGGFPSGEDTGGGGGGDPILFVAGQGPDFNPSVVPSIAALSPGDFAVLFGHYGSNNFLAFVDAEDAATNTWVSLTEVAFSGFPKMRGATSSITTAVPIGAGVGVQMTASSWDSDIVGVSTPGYTAVDVEGGGFIGYSDAWSADIPEREGTGELLLLAVFMQGKGSSIVAPPELNEIGRAAAGYTQTLVLYWAVLEDASAASFNFTNDGTLVAYGYVCVKP